jgi:hypothetical protein
MRRSPTPDEHEDEADQRAAEVGEMGDATTEQGKTGNPRQKIERKQDQRLKILRL